MFALYSFRVNCRIITNFVGIEGTFHVKHFVEITE